MLSEIKQFDRGDHTLFIDTGTGEKWTQAKGETARPGVIQRAVNFAGAAVKHVAAGRPKADEETIKERFAICAKCPSALFQILATESVPASLRELPIVGTCTHKSCGCFIHDQPIFPNKLSWADQVCPMGHWAKVEVNQSTCTKKGCC